MFGRRRTNDPGDQPKRSGRAAPRTMRAAARALAFGVAALALAVGSTAASTQVPTDTGSVGLAVGGNIATVYTSIHTSTHVAVSSVPVGTSVHVALSIVGSAGPATGAVFIREYDSGTCSGLGTHVYETNMNVAVGGTAIDAVNVVLSSNTATTKAVHVEYAGDATYASAVGPCRTISWVKQLPKVDLKIHNVDHDVVSSVSFIEQVHASVQVNGEYTVPQGIVVVRSWENDACSGDDYIYSSKFVDGNGYADAVLTAGFVTPSTRSFRAHYNGSAYYTAAWSDCVTVDGKKIAPQLSLLLHDDGHESAPPTVLINTPIHAAAGVRGFPYQPTGTFDLQVFDDATCQNKVYSQSGAAVVLLDDPDFGLVKPDAPTAVSWLLTYSGDSAYKPAASECKTIQFVAAPSVTLSVHDGSHKAISSAIVGTRVHLDVVVDGGFGIPTGKVSVQSASAASCAGASSFGTGGLAGGVLDDATLTYKASTAGTVWFRASYKGSSTYAATKSACIAVQFSAAPTAPQATPGPQKTPGAPADPGATTDPGTASGPEATADPGASDGPVDLGGGTADASAAPSDGPESSAATEPTAAPGAGGTTPGQGAGPGADTTPLLIGAGGLLLLALLGGAFWLGASRRRQVDPTPASEPLSAAQSS